MASQMLRFAYISSLLKNLVLGFFYVKALDSLVVGGCGGSR
jgi:hypothetical protein